MTARNLYRVGVTAAIATSATVVGSVALGAQSADAAQCQSTNQGLSYGAAYRTTLTWIASLAHLETYGNSSPDYGIPGPCRGGCR